MIAELDFIRKHGPIHHALYAIRKDQDAIIVPEFDKVLRLSVVRALARRGLLLNHIGYALAATAAALESKK